jgi:hypothetical protein
MEFKEEFGANAQRGEHEANENAHDKINEIYARRKKLSQKQTEPDAQANKRLSKMIKSKTKNVDINDLESDVNTEIKRYQNLSKQEQIKLMNADSE